MKRTIALGIGALCTGALGGAARADGYCDHVKGVAAAESALYYSPEFFGSVGYVEQPQEDVVGAETDGVRITAGLRYSISDLIEANATKKHATADCDRHLALDKIEGASSYRAVTARVRVLDAALEKAEKMLADADSDLRSGRATAQVVAATRLRVDEVRTMAASAHAELEGLPDPGEGTTLSGALGAYYRADAAMETQEGALRRAKAWDVSVRFGYDQFLGRENDPPFFGVVSLTFDLGWFAQVGANKRAASGRSRAVREEHGTAQIDSSTTRLQAMLDLETQRAEETAVLVDDLEKQLKALQKLAGDESRRYRETVWFDWVKVKAEHDYLVAHIESLREILGEDSK
jgi:hypothetical protein